LDDYLLDFDNYSFTKRPTNYLSTIINIIPLERGDKFLEDFLEKEVSLMLFLIHSLFKESPLPLRKVASQQSMSVKTIRRMITSELNLKLPIQFSIEKGALHYPSIEESLTVADLQKKPSVPL
jgi:hypothetical protein